MIDLGANGRKLVLTLHIATSVGWLGAVIGFLALAIAGLASTDPALVRGAYVSMKVIGWFVIVPMSVASLLTGVVESLGTPWGLVRHYWVIIKLLVTLIAIALLVLHMGPTTRVSGIAVGSVMSAADQLPIRRQLVGDAAAAVALLLVTTTLSVYKPKGLTPYGWRKQYAQAVSGE